MYTSQQLREIAVNTVNISKEISKINEKIYLEALKGKLYILTGFPRKYLNELKEECEKKQIRFIDKGNDGSGSLYTTIHLDWSTKGDGMLYDSDFNENK